MSCTAYVLDLFHPPARRKEENTGSGRETGQKNERGRSRGRGSWRRTRKKRRARNVRVGEGTLRNPVFLAHETRRDGNSGSIHTLKVFASVHASLHSYSFDESFFGGLCWAVFMIFSLHFRVVFYTAWNQCSKRYNTNICSYTQALAHRTCNGTYEHELATYHRAAAFPNRLSSIAATGISNKYAAESVGPPRVMGWLLHVLRTTRHGMCVRCGGLC